MSELLTFTERIQGLNRKIIYNEKKTGTNLLKVPTIEMHAWVQAFLSLSLSIHIYIYIHSSMVVESIYLDNPSDDVTLALWTVNFATHAYILPVCVYIYIIYIYMYGSTCMPYLFSQWKYFTEALWLAGYIYIDFFETRYSTTCWFTCSLNMFLWYKIWPHSFCESVSSFWTILSDRSSVYFYEYFHHVPKGISFSLACWIIFIKSSIVLSHVIRIFL